jgi:hypothetical protein
MLLLLILYLKNMNNAYRHTQFYVLMSLWAYWLIWNRLKFLQQLNSVWNFLLFHKKLLPFLIMILINIWFGHMQIDMSN